MSVFRLSSSSVINSIAIIYAFTCCLNQYYQVLGIPLFLYALGLLMLAALTSMDFKIKIGNTFKNYCPVLIAWLIYGFILTVINNNSSGWRFLLLLFINILSFVVILDLDEKKIVKQNSYIKGISLGLLFNFAIVIWELTTGNHLVPLTEDYERRFLYRPLGFYVNTNDLSVVVVSILFLLLVALFSHKLSRKESILIIVHIIVCLLIILSSGSFTCLVLVPGILLFSILIFQFRKNYNKGFLVLIILLLGILVLLLVFISPEQISGFFNNNEIQSFSGRSEIWYAEIKALKNSMFLGIGPGQSTVQVLGLAHNIFVEILTEYGVFITIWIIAIYVKSLKYQHEKMPTFANSLGLAYLLMLIPLSVASSSITKLFPVWVIVALIIAIDDRREKDRIDFNSGSNISQRG